jgi:NAD(P)H-hydrate repair Nnr-like enzyme with NAD(P)H-hydrate dehydratase domain
MKRLLQCEAEEIEADPLAAARTAAERFGRWLS